MVNNCQIFRILLNIFYLFMCLISNEHIVVIQKIQASSGQTQIILTRFNTVAVLWSVLVLVIYPSVWLVV